MRELTAVPVDPGTKISIQTREVPACVRVTLAQTLFEAIHRDFERPEVRADYERWKAEREARKVRSR
jgi:hypothetical protein